MKTIVRKKYGEVVVNNTTTGFRSRIRLLTISSNPWKGGGMNDCNIACFVFEM